MTRIICLCTGLIWAISLAGQSSLQQDAPFSISITGLPSYHIGHPVIVHITLRNVSQKAISIPEERHEGWHGEYNYQVSVRDAHGNPLADTEMGRKIKERSYITQGSVLIKQLEPGEEIAEDADLDNLISFPQPGDYVVQVVRDDEQYRASQIKSNKFTIHILP